MDELIVSEAADTKAVKSTRDFTSEYESYARAKWEQQNPYQTPTIENHPDSCYSQYYDPNWEGMEF